jgi:DNA-binding winged helix-turn-helix (wHTH) protein
MDPISRRQVLAATAGSSLTTTIVNAEPGPFQPRPGDGGVARAATELPPGDKVSHYSPKKIADFPEVRFALDGNLPKVTLGGWANEANVHQFPTRCVRSRRSTTSPDGSCGAPAGPASDAWSHLGARNANFIGRLAVGTSNAINPRAIAKRLARPEALLQRRAEVRETILRVGTLELDLIERTARRDKRWIDLLPREFRLLKYMMQHSDQLLARGTLLHDVWHCKFIPKTNRVDVHMSRLRHKVDGPNEMPMIHNVRGVGFILQADS